MYNLSVDSQYTQKRKYDMARFMRYDADDEFYDILDSAFIRALPSVQRYASRTVTFEEGNPALVSELVYGYFQWMYYWIVLESNNLIAPDDMIAGLNLNLPLLASLDSIFGQLSTKKN